MAHIILDMHKGVKRVCKLPCWRVCYVATYKCSLDVRLASFPGLPRFSVLRFPLTIIHGYGRAAVYYCQRKPKNRKNGVGLGTRLMYGSIFGMQCQLYMQRIRVNNVCPQLDNHLFKTHHLLVVVLGLHTTGI